MFDWIRNVRKSAQERRAEMITAYIDGELTASERSQFERDLSNNAALQQEVDAQRETKRLLSDLPPVRAPRNFTLDPAIYGKTKPQPSFLAPFTGQLRVASTAIALLLVMFIGYATFNLAPDSIGQVFNDVTGTLEDRSEESIALQEAPASSNTPTDIVQFNSESEIIAADEALEEESAEEEMIVAEMAEAEMEMADAIEREEDEVLEQMSEIQSPRTGDSDDAIVRASESESEEAEETGDIAAGSPLPAMTEVPTSSPTLPPDADPASTSISSSRITQPTPTATAETLEPTPTADTLVTQAVTKQSEEGASEISSSDATNTTEIEEARSESTEAEDDILRIVEPDPPASSTPLGLIFGLLILGIAGLITFLLFRNQRGT